MPATKKDLEVELRNWGDTHFKGKSNWWTEKLDEYLHLVDSLDLQAYIVLSDEDNLHAIAVGPSHMLELRVDEGFSLRQSRLDALTSITMEESGKRQDDFLITLACYSGGDQVRICEAKARHGQHMRDFGRFLIGRAL